MGGLLLGWVSLVGCKLLTRPGVRSDQLIAS